MFRLIVQVESSCCLRHASERRFGALLESGTITLMCRRVGWRTSIGCAVGGVRKSPVGDEKQTAGEGMVVWAAAGADHGVTNTGAKRLVLLVGIAPFLGK